MNTMEYPPKEGHPELVALAERLELLSNKSLSREEIISESKEIVTEALKHLESDLGLELSPDVTSIYNQMFTEGLLARVEDTARVLRCIAENEPITVGGADKHYANSVIADPEGLRIAMAEAEAFGPIRLLVGLDLKTLVGFRNDHLEVSEIDHNEFDMRDTSLRAGLCRHVNGEIRREDVRYMIMRIPKSMFPVDKLSEQEKSSASQFIFRGVEMPASRQIQEDLPMAA
jgi:hypothetical protein